MKINLIVLCSLVMIALVSAGCGAQPTSVPDVVNDVATAIPEITELATVMVDDIDSLTSALQTAGASVEAGEDVEQVFFTTAGKILKVNGADVQVFVYDTAQAMEAEAAQVAADGGSIGTNMVTWMDVPHFYKLGRMLVLYVGDDPAVKALLEGVLGPQFAGR